MDTIVEGTAVLDAVLLTAVPSTVEPSAHPRRDSYFHMLLLTLYHLGIL